MKRFLVLAFAFILTIGVYSFAYAQDPIDECFNYLAAQDYHRAIASGQQAVSLYPNNISANICLGRAYYYTGQLDLALNSLKQAAMYATSEQNLAATYSWLGVTYAKKGDLNNALAYNNKALALYKELGDKKGEAYELNDLAQVFRDKGEFDKALNYYEKSLSLSSEKDKANVYNNIAMVYGDKKEYPKVVSYLKKAIAIDTRYGNYQASGADILNLGYTYKKMKDFNKAYHYLQEGLKMVKKVGDKYWEATGYRYLGSYFKDKGNKKLAEDYFTKAYTMFRSIGALSDAADARIRLLAIGANSFTRAQHSLNNCALYLKNHYYQEAITSGQQAISLYQKAINYPNSDSGIAYANLCLGKAYYHTEQFESALDSFKKAAMYKKDSGELKIAYDWLGRTYYRKGDLDKALIYYNKALWNTSGSFAASILENMAEIFREKGELNRALRYYSDIDLESCSEKDKATIYNDRAVIYGEKKEYIKALIYFKKALARDTKYDNEHESGRDMLNLGNTYREMKDFNNAYHYLQEGLKIEKKAGDKYSEAAGYKYLDWYFRDKGDKRLAQIYLTKSDEIFESIGGGTEAQNASYSLK